MSEKRIVPTAPSEHQPPTEKPPTPETGQHKTIAEQMEELHFHRLTEQELHEASFEALAEQWRKNHAILLTYLQTHTIPFFGLHGTPEKAAKKILKEKSARLELATFYKKSSDEAFLYSLYDMAIYPFSYTEDKEARVLGKEQTDGVILVFHLEDDQGRNISDSWEHLKTGNGFSLALALDTERERSFLESLQGVQQKENQHQWRTDHVFSDSSSSPNHQFSEHFSGSIDFKKDERLAFYLKKFVSKDNPGSEIAKVIYRIRFLAQEILLEAILLASNRT